MWSVFKLKGSLSSEALATLICEACKNAVDQNESASLSPPQPREVSIDSPVSDAADRDSIQRQLVVDQVNSELDKAYIIFCRSEPQGANT
jgi:hypothetical protein